MTAAAPGDPSALGLTLAAVTAVGGLFGLVMLFEGAALFRPPQTPPRR